jgi:uncharacterized protein YjdB
LAFAGYAQTAASYIFTRTTGTYTSIASTGTPFTGINLDDIAAGGVPLGFSFLYNNTSTSTVAVSSNGWLSLANYSATNNNSPASGSIASAGFLFPFWTDGNPEYGGSAAYYQTTGSPGSRVFTFEWENWDVWNSSGGYTSQDMDIQIKLYEGSNIIQFCYGPSTLAVTLTNNGIGFGNSTSDFQVLPNTTSTTTSTTFSATCGIPANGTILQWCPPTAAITGNAPICQGATRTLSSTTTGGTWSSSNASVATVGSGSGIVTSVAAGTATITYTKNCSFATAVVTVNAAPGASTGNTPVNICSSFTLSNSLSGTWTSSNSGIAAVNSSGVVTGVSAGNANITFTATTGGCFTISQVTVNALPAITGSSGVCTGLSTTLSHTTSGGSWTSSSTSVATVTSGGVVNGVSAGTVTITYTVPGGCIVTKAMTVNSNPAAISGASTVCGGSVPSSTTLTNSTSGGTWSSSDITKATVGSPTGIVTGVASGSATISYTTSNGCYSTRTMSVIAVSPITGPSGMCNGESATLSSATFGGVWSSSSTSVATIGSSSGVVSSVSIGCTNITYSVSSMGCAAALSFCVTNTPAVYSVTGGGSYCAGGAGVHVGINNSTAGVSYVVYNGATAVGGGSGTGTAADFGLFTTAGTYTVVGNPGTACATNMSGSVVVTINPLPTAFTVGGGGSYCSGGTGVNITLSSSTIGVGYQLMLGATPIGSAIVGTSGALTFGPVTTAGAYTVVATNATTGCINTMSGSASVSINSLPTVFAITGGGNFCLGGSGVAIGLAGSATGTTYQLLLAGSPVGSAVTGTGGAISFGLITTAGSYTVRATNTSTGCTGAMSGTATVVVNSLPAVYTVTGGGPYCFGGTGSAVGLNGSQTGVSYQLFNGSTAVGSPVPGSGTAITFGLQIATGSYTVVATNTSTGCIANMFGSASVSTNPLPTVFNVTGGGSYCAGGTGVALGLSGSSIGTTYQLYNGATLVGAAAGTGGPISFGLQTGAGTYTVVGTTTSTGCVGNMAGSATVVINPLPTVFTVMGGGNYCATGTGVAVSLNSSTSGVNYQLYNGSTPVGLPVPGTGSTISFGMQTAAGSYTAVAVNATTGCVRNMSGSAAVIVNPLPTTYAVTGGGGYCAGGAGVHVGLANSNPGISYQLMNSGGPVGTALAGTGSALDYGFITTSGAYTILATNPATGCQNTMSGSAVVNINPLPVPHTVTGGGNYCTGGSGIPVGLFTSTTGVNYQLYRGTTAVGASVPGTGGPISFGAQTVAGPYTVSATNATTGCTNNMLGTVSVGINPLPGLFVVTGGGNYCTGGTGLHVGLSGSASGITYQLMNGLATVGAPMPGTGGAIDFGLQTGTGTYTVVATNPSTGCVNTMTGSVSINTYPLPGLYTISGGGNYCSGGTGVTIGLTGSATGVSYQLYNGSTAVGAPRAGTGAPLSFGLQAVPGTYTVVGTTTATGCSRTMIGTTTVVANPLPALHNITGGGNYCVGGAGVNIGLDNSTTGISYQLYKGTVAVGSAVPGSTGAPISFGLQTALGMYTVVATNTATSCTANMTGSVLVGTYTLPTVYVVTGGGNYCSGGSGVHVGLSGSNTSDMYQLMNGGSFVGSPVTGTGGVIDFGFQTGAGIYTVVATNTANGCSSTMSGSVNIGVFPLPTAYTVTGGGNYCTSGAGVHVGLSGSNMGTLYQLKNGSSNVGAPMPGTGLALDFGLQTAAGNYTVVATNISTTCVNTMTGSVNISLDPLPAVYPATGGGNYCAGGAGVSIGLGSSDAGITYQLMNGTTLLGSPITGTGLAIDFGPQTGAGVYTIRATDIATGCVSNITGISVGIDPLPALFVVGGGGHYCSGGAGVHITLSGSATGISYQLMNGSSPSSLAIAGTGAALDFGTRAAAGTYTVVASNNTTGCISTMTGSAAVVIDPLPAMYSVSSTSSTYCAGGTGVDVGLTGSDAGISYQLYRAGVVIGSAVAGTGGPVSFGFQTSAGMYTAVGTNTTTGCTNNMSSSVTVVVNAIPVAFTVTGGGGYCSGGPGVAIGLSSSTPGISYQLMLAGGPSGSPVMGTGGPLNFGMRTTAGTYTVVATNPATTCTNTMTGSVIIVVNAIPITYTVTGGGNYCFGGTGVSVTLSGSDLGVNYQLYRGLSAVGLPVAGTGSMMNFGLQTGVGSYTVVATDAIGGCTNNMTGSVSVSINPAPTVYPVIGGGNYCPGGTGVHVGISGSASGATYQLYRGGVAIGSPVAGTGIGGIDFGLQTTAGTYTVMATNTATGCTGAMSGSASVAISPAPAAFNVIGGGNYCAGGAGLHIGLSGSAVGVNYTLYRGFTSVVTVPGTGGPIDFGMMATAGNYTAIGVNTSTTCQSTMLGSVDIIVNAMVTPGVTINTGVGDTVCEGSLVTFTASPVNGGLAPAYQWRVNGVNASTAVSYTYVPSNGDVIELTLTSSAVCASPTTAFSSVTMTVQAHKVPAVSVSANPGTLVCQGTSVTFTAAPINGGSAPSYTWFRNGISAGASPVFTYIPANGDVVYAMLTSNERCRTANTANSTSLTMNVDVPALPVVTITSNPGTNIAAGQTATFTATALNGGPTPSYQWLINGMPVAGATSPIFSTNALFDNDSVTCQVLSSGGCPGLLGFNSVRIHIYGVGVQNVATTASDIRLMPNPSKGTFTVKGTLGAADEEVSLEVTNMLGQVIYRTSVQARNGELNERIDLGNSIANGMYILNLRSGAEQKVFHIVIEQ